MTLIFSRGECQDTALTRIKLVFWSFFLSLESSNTYVFHFVFVYSLSKNAKTTFQVEARNIMSLTEDQRLASLSAKLHKLRVVKVVLSETRIHGKSDINDMGIPIFGKAKAKILELGDRL